MSMPALLAIALQALPPDARIDSIELSFTFGVGHVGSLCLSAEDEAEDPDSEENEPLAPTPLRVAHRR